MPKVFPVAMDDPPVIDPVTDPYNRIHSTNENDENEKRTNRPITVGNKRIFRSIPGTGAWTLFRNKTIILTSPYPRLLRTLDRADHAWRLG